jgi:hypothetical protein
MLSYKTAERARYSLQTNDFLLHWWRIQKGEKNVWLFIKGQFEFWNVHVIIIKVGIPYLEQNVQTISLKIF